MAEQGSTGESPPEPSPSAPRSQRRIELNSDHAVAALSIAATAAILAPGSRPGVGLTLVALTLVAATARLVERPDRWQRLCLLLAAGLSLAPLLRDAGWVVACALGTGLVLNAATVAGGTTWSSLLSGPGRMLSSLPLAPAAVLRATPVHAPVGLPAEVSFAGVMRGSALGGSMVLVFGALFASADGAFAQLAGDIAPGSELFSVLPARFGAGALAGAVAGGLAMVSVGAAPDATAASAQRRLAPIEWTLALGSLAVLFVLFVAIQFVVLFGGVDHVLETADLTYSEYACQGFGQLLFVAILVLGVVAAAKRWAAVDGPRQSRLLRGLLCCLCICTLVIVASALHRLDIYVDAFGATRTRVFAAIACASIGVVVGLVLAGLITDRDRWLPRASIATAGVAALALVLVNPEGWIASRNVERYERDGEVDLAYAASLSADAVPDLSTLPPQLAADALAAQRARLGEGDGAFGLNFGRESARETLDEAP